MSCRGFTLIELIVVMVLIGMVMAISAPRIRSALWSDNLKRSTRQLLGLIDACRSDAVREQTAVRLHFDLDTERIWTELEDFDEEARTLARENATALPEGVHILDIWLGGKGKAVAGETTIRFNKDGYVQQSAIHLESEDRRRFTLVLRPFLERVQVVGDYLELEVL